MRREPSGSEGRVYLVGAGPGDPGLITCRGMECLRRADVVVYDRLVSPVLLGEAPLQAERICAAKSAGSHRMGQREIEAILVDRARRGRSVVRLKGGDPFVFGRGGEEALALAEAGIPFEVVPGVTSAVAVPAYAGIPVTHRGVAAGFAVWTGHRASGAGAGPIDAPTQVILMGVGTLDETVAALLAQGRDPHTPAAVISWGSTGRQQAAFAPLERLPAEAKAREIRPPATVIVGGVVALSDRLAWWAPPQGAHAGERVALLRPAGPGDPTYDALHASGAEVAVLPLQDASGWVEAIARCLCDLAAEEMVDRFVFPSWKTLESFLAARESLGLGPLGPLLAKACIEEGDGSLRPLDHFRYQPA